MANTSTAISSESNLAALNLCPLPNTKRSIETLSTAATVFDIKQAIELAKRPLIANEAWDKIALTGFRLRPLASDGRFVVTVTPPSPSRNRK